MLLSLSLLAEPGTLESRAAFRLAGSARLALVVAAKLLETLQSQTQTLGHQDRHASADFMLMLCAEALEAAVAAMQVVWQVEAQAAAALRGSVCRPGHLAALCCRAAACLDHCTRTLEMGEAWPSAAASAAAVQAAL